MYQVKTRKCKKCGRKKSIEKFSFYGNGEEYRRHTCKVCQVKIEKERFKKLKDGPLRQRNCRLKREYGIDLKTYNKMVKKQNNKCAICGNECPHLGKLSIDHDHTTGEVRDLLCANCNKGLGLFKENPAFLLKASQYLTTWQQ